MARADDEKWDARYAEKQGIDGTPLPFLAENIDKLGSGKALVLAAGAGRNAIYLAEQGFRVSALDVSQVGLDLCRRLASEKGVSLQTIHADLESFDLGVSRYDLITKIYYHQPSLFPRIRENLKTGGRFLFHTFSKRHAEVGTFGPRNPTFLASIDDALSTFQADRILISEDTTLTDEEGTQAVVRLLLEKR